MTAYAIGILRGIQVGDDVVEYLRRIDATLAPYGGRFLVHGGPPPEVREGSFDDTALVLIGFDDLDSARAWYDSPGYREILELRTRNSDSTVLLVEGCDPDHRATDILAAVTGGAVTQ